MSRATSMSLFGRGPSGQKHQPFGSSPVPHMGPRDRSDKVTPLRGTPSSLAEPRSRLSMGSTALMHVLGYSYRIASDPTRNVWACSGLAIANSYVLDQIKRPLT